MLAVDGSNCRGELTLRRKYEREDVRTIARFLLDHFADALAYWQKPGLIPLSHDADVDLPVPTSNMFTCHSGISTPTRTTASSLARSDSSTPVRQILPSPTNDDQLSPVYSTPTDRRHSSLSVSSGRNDGLFPFDFIRKASESPPVREREKVKLRAGRRSILGREGSVGL